MKNYYKVISFIKDRPVSESILFSTKQEAIDFKSTLGSSTQNILFNCSPEQVEQVEQGEQGEQVEQKVKIYEENNVVIVENDSTRVGKLQKDKPSSKISPTNNLTFAEFKKKVLEPNHI